MMYNIKIHVQCANNSNKETLRITFVSIEH